MSPAFLAFGEKCGRHARFRGSFAEPVRAVQEPRHEDHSGFTLDGFVFDGESRNSCTNDVVATKAPTCQGMRMQTNSPKKKIRNCILINPVGDGICCPWQGQGNEIVDNSIVSTFYAAIETCSAQPDTTILVKNNTIAFGWSYPGKGGSIGIFVGRLGTTIIVCNIIAFLQSEAGEDGMGVKNTFGNDATVMKHDVFFSCVGFPEN